MRNFDEFRKEFKEYRDAMEVRVRALEDFRLVFVTKFTVYSALALFFGSVISTVGIHYINNYLNS